ncbi:alpha/beta fold hydrolase [Cyclobacterium jeungdonense]|uniref:Alpha/beta hydrolase n=1 Tax=Cyclobacterium jeungdonense TaxID=708087 RepID=A0ABT8C4L2_9BACT|nr:alpha/beta hydrolase [Cyclobacterium jeungdonense]MDN3687656.1 alpha/beta hydrolase [Cyclobacterium jeungdonense]
MSKETFVYRFLGMYLNALTRFWPRKGGKTVFKLFCTPKPREINREELEFLQTASQSDVDFHGQSIRTYTWGTGPKKVLLVHGWQSLSARWKPLVEMLIGSEFTLFAFDAPGHGLSGGKQFTIPENAELIHRMMNGQGNFEAVVGHSLGSLSLLYASSRHPLPEIKKWVLMAPPISLNDLVSLFRKTLCLNPGTMHRMTEEMKGSTPGGLETFELAQLARNLSSPGLIIHDKEDDRVHYSNAKQLAAVWPQARLLITRGMGHRLRSTKVVLQVSTFIMEPTKKRN